MCRSGSRRSSELNLRPFLARTSVCVCTCMCAYVCVRTCVHVCVCACSRASFMTGRYPFRYGLQHYVMQGGHVCTVLHNPCVCLCVCVMVVGGGGGYLCVY